ncbi:MAG: hypothetical protein RBR22_11500 [Desulfuromonas sp.]|nr:hypothetical protein [Desulfuromonas sp.]
MKTKGNDFAASLSKGLVGAIPFVGPIAAEIVGAIIPNQRMDRIEVFLHKLEEKLEAIDQNQTRENFSRPEQIDLLEDAFLQASRAMSDDRKEYLASLVKNSLQEVELRHLEYKRLLSILGQLNDVQIIILKYYSLERLQGEAFHEFQDKHNHLIRPPLVHMGSSPEEFDRKAIFDDYRSQLIELSLLQRRFKKPKRGASPEFDEKTGMIKTQGFGITHLGRMLLRLIDQNNEESS